MKAINIKLASFTFAAMLLASCSDSNDVPGGSQLSPNVVGKEVNSITDAQALAARVRNYKSTDVTSRAAGYNGVSFTKENINLGNASSMDAEPTNIPTAKLSAITDPWNDRSGSFVIKTGDSFLNENGGKKNYNLASVTAIYIDGTVDLNSFDCWNNSNVAIIVTKNGHLTNFKWGKFKKVYNYGKIDVASNISLESGSILKSKGSINMNGYSIEVKDGSALYVGENLTNVQNLSTPLSDGGAAANVHIVGNLSCSSNLSVKGSNVLIEGNANAKDVILEKNAKLKVNKKLTCDDGKLSTNASYAEIGELEGEQALFYAGAKGYISGAANLTNGTFHSNASTVEIGGLLTCKIFENEANSTTNLLTGVTGLQNTKIKIDGIVNIEGKTNVKGIEFVGNGILYCCSLTVDEGNGDVDLNGGDGQGSALHTSYIKAKNITIASSTNIYLVNNSMIDCSGTLECKKNGSANVFLTGKDAKALIKATTLKFNGSGSSSTLNDCYVFNAKESGGVFYFDVDKVDNSSENGHNQSLSDVNFCGSGKAHNFRLTDSPIKLVEADCGYTLEPEKPTPPHIDEVGQLEYDHTHDISATCIQPYNGKLYMSYHTRGTGHGGCIEVFQTDNQKQTQLLQYLQDTDNALDFNHLMIDSKSSTPNLYVVGNYGYTDKTSGKQSDAGAMMARIDLKSNGLLNTEVQNIGEAAINPLIIVPLENNQSNSEDENAIVRDGDNLLVTSTRGYEVYDPNTLELKSSKKTDGKAKHIVLNSNSNEIATLYYNNRNLESTETAVTGTLELFDAGSTDITTATPKKSIPVSEIAPNNGKNTIAIDGNNIYVCRSANGLTCYDKTTGNEKWTWQAPLTATTKKPQGYANGVTFDDKYIYLACGGYGLVILEKNNIVDGKPVVHAKTRVTGVVKDNGTITWNSANYVTLYNGLIYVAYGKSRLMVYQLIEGSVTGSAGNTTTTEEQK